MYTKLFTLIAAATFITRAVPAGYDFAATPQKFTKTITRTVSLEYMLRLPPGYDAKGSEAKRWPLLLFLHGAGERGTNLPVVLKHGPWQFLEAHPELPFIVIAPQCPAGEVWSNEALLALLDEVGAKLRVDSRRVYLTGLSMGGYGTWSLGITHPERFAAIAPICGGGETVYVRSASRTCKEALQSLGVWAFHGAKDPIVPVTESERMIDVLKKTGVMDVELTVYPEALHDSWKPAYADAKLYEWLLRHERK